MTTYDQGLRKAAILIDTLDQASADALLEQLTGESADQIRRELLGLECVEPTERSRIRDELCECTTSSDGEPNVLGEDAGVSYNDRTTAAGDSGHTPSAAHHLSDFVDASVPAGEPIPTIPDSEPFAFLNNTPMEVLTTFLAGEHPQAVSIVLAHLSPPRAAEYLATLAGERRADVLRRLARLDVTDAEVISDVEHGLQALLANHVQTQGERPMGLATLEAILNAVGDEQRREFLGHLRSATRESAGDEVGVPYAAGAQQMPNASPAGEVFHTRIAATEFPLKSGSLLDALTLPACSSRVSAPTAPANSPPQGTEAILEFEDFADLDDTALARIFRAADPQVSLLALCGAGRDLVDLILGRLPLREARVLRREIEQLGPTRLRDIESAQRRLADLARRMADEGQIQVPGDRRFTVAA